MTGILISLMLLSGLFIYQFQRKEYSKIFRSMACVFFIGCTVIFGSTADTVIRYFISLM